MWVRREDGTYRNVSVAAEIQFRQVHAGGQFEAKFYSGETVVILKTENHDDLSMEQARNVIDKGLREGFMIESTITQANR